MTLVFLTRLFSSSHLVLSNHTDPLLSSYRSTTRICNVDFQLYFHPAVTLRSAVVAYFIVPIIPYSKMSYFAPSTSTCQSRTSKTPAQPRQCERRSQILILSCFCPLTLVYLLYLIVSPVEDLEPGLYTIASCGWGETLATPS